MQLVAPSLATRERLNAGTPAVDIRIIMTAALQVIAGIGLLGFLLGWLLPVRAIWHIVFAVSMGVAFTVLASGSETPEVYALFSLAAVAYWSLLVLAGRGLRRLMR